MSKLVLQDQANVVGYVATAALTGGQGFLLGNMFTVPEQDVASNSTGKPVALRVRGVLQIAKAGSLAVAIGDALYWDDSGKVVNKTNTNKEVGWAVSSTGSGSGETTCAILLVPTIRNATNS